MKCTLLSSSKLKRKVKRSFIDALVACQLYSGSSAREWEAGGTGGGEGQRDQRQQQPRGTHFHLGPRDLLALSSQPEQGHPPRERLLGLGSVLLLPHHHGAALKTHFYI